MEKYIGYKLYWGDKPTEKEVEAGLLETEDWTYPEGMIERIVYSDYEFSLYRFPEPMTLEDIKSYDESLLDIEAGYELVKE